MKTIGPLFLAAALLAGSPLAADAPPLAPYQPPVNHTSTIRIWGDRNMESLTHAWAAAYRTRHPEITFEIKLLGTGTGMPALYLGQADLAFFGRDLITTDKDGFAHVLKYNPSRVELGTGSLDQPGHSSALVLFVHRDNPLTQLTLPQVDAIFSTLRRRGAPAAIRTWGDLGLAGEWAHQPIHLYADDSESVSALFFQRVALGDSRMMNWEHFTEFRDIWHADGTVSEAAGQSMAALREDRYGLAISNLHYLNADVKPLALAGRAGGEYYAATKEALIARTYPLTRTIFACASQPPGRALDPKVRRFLLFILSPAGQQVLAQEGSYLPLTAKMAQEERKKLE